MKATSYVRCLTVGDMFWHNGNLFDVRRDPAIVRNKDGKVEVEVYVLPHGEKRARARHFEFNKRVMLACVLVG